MPKYNPCDDAYDTPATVHGRDWSSVRDDARLEIARSGALPYLAYRVLDVLIHSCDRHGHWHGTQTTLAAWMGSTQPSISAALAHLTRAGYVTRGGRRCYIISGRIAVPMAAPQRRPKLAL